MAYLRGCEVRLGRSDAMHEIVIYAQLAAGHSEVVEQLPNHLLVMCRPHAYLRTAAVGCHKRVLGRGRRPRHEFAATRIYRKPVEIELHGTLQYGIHTLQKILITRKPVMFAYMLAQPPRASRMHAP